MSSKLRNEITSEQFIRCLTNLGLDVGNFSTNAVEALRLCHMEFILFIASEMGRTRKETSSSKPIKEGDVEKCFDNLQLNQLLEECKYEIEKSSGYKRQLEAKTKKVKMKARIKKKRKLVNLEALDEQEHLLAESAKASNLTIEWNVKE
mmetsp:Transcript_15476/g.20153  ORF Transcript_15476/g.20153 Transcript_15476/m.20153 type:complete len:149 (-) Transcript_15476:448-894(-)